MIRRVLLCLFTVCLTVPAFAKWGKKKPAPAPLVVPAPPFSADVDPREVALRQFVQRRRVQLYADLLTYPAYKDEIAALILDSEALTGMAYGDPDFPVRFMEFRASLYALAALESEDAI